MNPLPGFRNVFYINNVKLMSSSAGLEKEIASLLLNLNEAGNPILQD